METNILKGNNVKISQLYNIMQVSLSEIQLKELELIRT